MPNIWEIYVWICVDMYRLIYLSILLSAVFGTIVEDENTAIINGNLASIEDFPYYAFLAVGKDLHCGGAFIERNLVLTAAHCLGGQNIRVYSGISSLKDLKRKKGYAVKSAVPHPTFWTAPNSAFDIGLIKLKRKIQLGDEAQLIELATEAPPVGEEAIVVGFGVMQCEGIAACNEEVQDSDHLRSADIVITNVLEDGTFLTQSRENMNTCYGDSGGPITHDGKVIGVVSTGEVGDCRGFDIQGPVFTLLDWINKTKATM
ncbi:hypothetical protein Trydic_g20573 [Trypoxylus dichotomus]